MVGEKALGLVTIEELDTVRGEGHWVWSPYKSQALVGEKAMGFGRYRRARH